MIRRALGGAFAACLFLSGGAWAQEKPFTRGDVNGDGALDISDPLAILFDLFAGSPVIPCLKAADLDDGGSVDISDAIFGLQYLFRGGAQPPPPFPECGFDPTPDHLSCDRAGCAEPPPAVEITESCSSDASRLGWTLTNTLSSPLSVDWKIQGSAISGTQALPALGTATISTLRVPGVNVLVAYRAGVEVARLAQGGIFFSEIMAWNAESLADQDGDNSDWIEIGAVDAACPLTTDLAGWYLTDDPSRLTLWKFPSVTIKSAGYLVVFASGKDRAVSGSELHTNFKLAKEGGYLALVAPDGVTVVDAFQPQYPVQLADVSYGLVQKVTTLVSPSAALLYHVPTSADAGLGDSWADPAFAASGWKAGTAGLGFTSIATEGFQVTCIKARVTVDSIAKAQAVLTTPSQQGQVTIENAPFIDYLNTGSSANFTNDRPFPGLGTVDVDDFVVQAKGTVVIPQVGSWSFGVNSDDGFHLDLTDGTSTFSMEYPTPRGPNDTIKVFNLPHTGPYDVNLVFYERGGGSELELFAAQGNHPTFNYTDFHLVGDTVNGGLSLLGFSSAIATDLGAEMWKVNASLWTRFEFQVQDPSSFGSMLLKMKYEDGFIAYLNGGKVATRNGSASPQWNSTASSNRPLEKAPVSEEISLTSELGRLVSGRNVLCIQGLNDAAADGDFLLQPELIAVARDVEYQYMRPSTPGKLNLPGGVDFVRDIQFDVEHGFFNAPFTLTLSTSTSAAVIRYTRDGSTPTSSTGTIYTGPLAISLTSVVRAAGFRQDYLDSAVGTRTYLFLTDVIRQSPTGQRPSAAWPSAGSVNGQVIDYGMDPDIVNNAKWSGQIKDALLAVPTISLVTDLANLFSPTSGIYVNAGRDGRAWERRASLELINPDGTPGFAVDAGIRIRGAYSRSGGNPKHAFHVAFRSEYGTSKLEYPLFGGEGVNRFDKIDLRCSENYSWAFEGSNQDTIIREVFSRDVQRDLGQPYTRSRYYHLYIDGQYWGVYQSEERAEASYAASYLGGKASDYDVVKNDSSSSRAIEAGDGTLDSYRRLYDSAVAGFSTDAAYYKVLGLKADGTPDPAGEKLLNAENLMDYMACAYYTGDPDSPVSCWGQISNNLFGIYDRVRPDGYVWIRHDAEHSLGANGGLSEGRLLTDPVCYSVGSDFGRFNPAWLHRQLVAHPEYVLQFADRVNRYFADDGPLSPDRNIERWLSRHDELELAIIGESARWGDSKVNPPRTQDDWEAQTDYMVSTYFPQRGPIVLAQMRSVGMFPNLAIVSFSLPAGEVAPGANLRLSQGNGTLGTIYYGLSGLDPRLRGGAIAAGAAVYQDSTPIVLDRSTTVKARVLSGGRWGALSERRFTIGLQGLVINEIMADNVSTLEDPDEPGEFPDWIEIYNGTSGTISLAGMYLTDDPLQLTKWKMAPQLSIASGGYLLFYADDDGTQGPYHTNFKLSSTGESLALVDTDGKTIIDSIVFDQQRTDVSIGRYPSGGNGWGFMSQATPGTANQPIVP